MSVIEPGPGPYDLRLSLNELDARDTYATYHADAEKGIIRQYLPALWDVSVENNPGAPEDLLVDVLMDALAITYLCERICITRAVDRLKIKGGRCHPCCVEPVALAMYDHAREY